MKSITVLEEEEKILEKIIKDKSLRKVNFDYFVKKQKLVSAYIKKIQRDVEYENLDQEEYIRLVKESITKEEGLIAKAKTDPNVEDLNFLTKRIQERIRVIKSELEEGEEMEQEVEKVEDHKINEETNNPLKDEVDEQKMVLTDNNLKTRDTLKENTKDGNNLINEDQIVLVEKDDKVEITNENQQESKLSKLERMISERMEEYKNALKYFKKVSRSLNPFDYIE